MGRSHCAVFVRFFLMILSEAHVLFITIIYIISSHINGINITAYSEMFYKSKKKALYQ